MTIAVSQTVRELQSKTRQSQTSDSPTGTVKPPREDALCASLIVPGRLWVNTNYDDSN